MGKLEKKQTEIIHLWGGDYGRELNKLVSLRHPPAQMILEG